ncbi:MAG: S8 family serine peptidase, partial [Planctomycetes bacterium]|nr:S8 family serine peptidase [Planctomycetota bacterium]
MRKRRPAGISRREKQRQLLFETLEDRRVMSATPVELDPQFTDDLIIRDVVIDQTVVNSFERVSDLSQYTEEDLAAAEYWVVLADVGSDMEQMAADGGFEFVGDPGVVPGLFYVAPGEGGREEMIAALSSSVNVDYFYPEVPWEIEPSIPNDEFLPFQWHLINLGQLVNSPNGALINGVPGEDINVEGAWNFEISDGVFATGNGVVIGIVDDGVQMNHPDLFDNINFELATDLLLVGSGNPQGDSPHGTAVAGLAAGVGDNGIGITGVAYEADIVPIRLLSNVPITEVATTTDGLIAASLVYQFNEIDVYNHSWGLVTEFPRTINDFGPQSLIAINNAVSFGRRNAFGVPLGSIHVFAAGNDGGNDSTSQYSGLTNSRYTIAVSAVDHDGRRANEDGTTTTYPEGGANVLVAAPSGSVALSIIRDALLGSGIYTTDLTGNLGYNEDPLSSGLELDNDFLSDIDYASRFSGTSAAAPLVTGVIALMLQVNPELTYRDVQHILVRSARQNNAPQPLDPTMP